MEKNVQELEMQAYKTFVCPNIGIIDEKGKVLGLKNDTIERAKNIAIEYFKKTYHKPRYSSAKYVFPAFIYIASILEDDIRPQTQISIVFSTTTVTIKRWYKEIVNTLNIELNSSKKKRTIDTDALLDEIDREGNVLSLRHSTIEKAKILALQYFGIVDIDEYFSHTKYLLPAFVYTASIIENDKRNQGDISQISGISEGTISKWHNNILRNLNMKIIRHRDHVIAVLKIRDDD